MLDEIRERHLAWLHKNPNALRCNATQAAYDRGELLDEIVRLLVELERRQAIVDLAQTYCATRRGIDKLEAALGLERTQMKRGSKA